MNGINIIICLKLGGIITMIFRKLGVKDHEKIMKYLLKEAEFNLFIIGDIENYGYNSELMTLWGVIDNDKNISGILLKYYTSFISYTYDNNIIKRFAPLINIGARVISGKKEIIDILKNYLCTDKIIEEKVEFFSRMVKLNTSIRINDELKIKRAEFKDVERLIELRNKIDEFRNLPSNRDSIINNFKLKNSRAFFIEDSEGNIISSASTSAENKYSAMIVGVATLPEYRGKGYATTCVYYLSKELLNENKTLCLFYDNPVAGQIYRQLGFREIGKWSIILLRD
jgi:uncharacterized protein